MIRRDDGELIATCNECGEEYPGGCQDDFCAFVQELKDAGWRIRNSEGEWEHFCPDCEEA